MDAPAANLITPPSPATPATPDAPQAAWSRRVRWVGGLIQATFAAFWLVRGSLAISGDASWLLLLGSGLCAVGVFAYAIRRAGGQAPRPAGPEGRRIERQVTIATVIEFAAAILLPVLVGAAGHPDWALPSIAITIGPLLLWLDHRLGIPRYRPVGWALTAGPVILVATLSGTALEAVTGIAAGLLLLGTALAGFHDLAALRPGAQSSPSDDAHALTAVRS